MEKITKEELMKMAQLTDEELDKIAAGFNKYSSDPCIDRCASKVPSGVRKCRDGDQYSFDHCYAVIMESFEYCKSMC